MSLASLFGINLSYSHVNSLKAVIIVLTAEV